MSPCIWQRRDWVGVANKTRKMVDWFDLLQTDLPPMTELRPRCQGFVDAFLTERNAFVLANQEILLAALMRLRRRGTDGLSTHRWREPDSNLYGAFPVKWCFWFKPSSLFGAGKPFFVPALAIRFAVRGEGVKGAKR